MSKPVVFGLNYAGAPFAMWEKMAFLPDEIPFILKRLISSGIVSEAIILSTCNRVEVYMIAIDIDFAINAICGIKNVCPMTIRKFSYIYTDIDCVRHLFRVASGLESMILGETEIVAQIKMAFKISKQSKALGTNLSGLFQMALAVAKEVRNDTQINRIASSMGKSLLTIINSRVSHLNTKKLLFIGAGSMITSIVPHFKNVFLKQTVLNRTLSKAHNIASKNEIEYASLEDLDQHVNETDVIIASCGSLKILLTKKILEQKIKNKKNILILDISVPHITDLELKKYANIEVLDIEDISKIVDVGKNKRKSAAIAAEKLITTKIDEYQAWLKKRGLSPVIKALRDKAEDLRIKALNKAKKQLENGDSIEKVLDNFSAQLMNKLLHAPTVNLAKTEHEMQDNLVHLVNHLYSL